MNASAEQGLVLLPLHDKLIPRVSESLDIIQPRTAFDVEGHNQARTPGMM